jgi:hypothetical protein
MIEPAGQPIGNGRFERVVMEHGRIDEGRELRLAPYDFFGFATDPPPNWVELIESRFYLMLRHRSVSPEVLEPSIITDAGIVKAGSRDCRPETQYI